MNISESATLNAPAVGRIEFPGVVFIGRFLDKFSSKICALQPVKNVGNRDDLRVRFEEITGLFRSINKF